MAVLESSKRDIVVRPGQKNAFGTVLAARLSIKLALYWYLTKRVRADAAWATLPSDKLNARLAADLRARSAVRCSDWLCGVLKCVLQELDQVGIRFRAYQ